MSTINLSTGITRDIYLWSDNTFYAPSGAYSWNTTLPSWLDWNWERKRLRATPTATGVFGPYTYGTNIQSGSVDFVVTDPINVDGWPIYYGTGTTDSSAATDLQTYLNYIKPGTFSAPTAAPGSAPSSGFVVGLTSYNTVPENKLGRVVNKYENGAYHIYAHRLVNSQSAVGQFLTQFAGINFWCDHYDVEVGQLAKRILDGLDTTIPSGVNNVLLPTYNFVRDVNERTDLAWGEGAESSYKLMGVPGDSNTRNWKGGSHGYHTMLETYNCRYGREGDWYSAHPCLVPGFAAKIGSSYTFSSGEPVTFSAGGSGVFNGYWNSTWGILESASRLPSQGESIIGTGGSVSLTTAMKDQGFPATVLNQNVTGRFLAHEPLSIQGGATARLGKHLSSGSYYAYLKDVVGTPSSGQAVTGDWGGGTFTLSSSILKDSNRIPLFYRCTVESGNEFTDPRSKGKFGCFTAPEVADEWTSIYRYLIDVDGDDPRKTTLLLAQEDTSSPGQRCKCGRCQRLRWESISDGAVHMTLTPLLNKTYNLLTGVYEHASVGAYAYQGNVQAGRDNLESGVIIRFAPIAIGTPIQVCDYHGPFECNYNADISEELRKWSTKTHRMEGWSYHSSFTGNFFQLKPLVYSMMLWYQGMYANKIRGAYFQIPGGPFQPFQLYCAANITLYPWKHPQDIIDEFCNGYYGEAAPYILNSIDAITNSVKGATYDHGAGTDSESDDLSWFTNTLVSTLQADFDSALAAVSGEEMTARIGQFYRPGLLTRDGRFIGGNKPASVVGNYLEGTDNGVPVLYREDIGQYYLDELERYASVDTRGSTASEYTDGVLGRWEGVKYGGTRLINMSSGDLSVQICADWEGLVRSIQYSGTEMLYQPNINNACDDKIAGTNIWPKAPGMIHMYDVATYPGANQEPAYLRSRRAINSRIVTSGLTHTVINYKEGLGDWGNGPAVAPYGNIQTLVFDIEDNPLGGQQFVISYSGQRGSSNSSNSRYVFQGCVDTRWQATTTSGDSNLTYDIPNRFYTIDVNNYRIKNQITDGLGYRSTGQEYNEIHSSTYNFMNVQTYYEQASAPVAPSSMLVSKNIITFSGI